MLWTPPVLVIAISLGLILWGVALVLVLSSRDDQYRCPNDRLAWLLMLVVFAPIATVAFFLLRPIRAEPAQSLTRPRWRDETLYCIHCGARIPSDSDRCDRCGSRTVSGTSGETS